MACTATALLLKLGDQQTIAGWVHPGSKQMRILYLQHLLIHCYTCSSSTQL